MISNDLSNNYFQRFFLTPISFYRNLFVGTFISFYRNLTLNYKTLVTSHLENYPNMEKLNESKFVQLEQKVGY